MVSKEYRWIKVIQSNAEWPTPIRLTAERPTKTFCRQGRLQCFMIHTFSERVCKDPKKSERFDKFKKYRKTQSQRFKKD